VKADKNLSYILLKKGCDKSKPDDQKLLVQWSFLKSNKKRAKKPQLVEMDMMDEAGDCSTDGTCEADSGDPDMAGGGPMGGKGASLLQGTNLAIQQFSIIVGVALLVGILFFAMIAIELTMDWFLTKLSEKCCKKKHSDEEDPAALVGSFKRYKN